MPIWCVYCNSKVAELNLATHPGGCPKWPAKVRKNQFSKKSVDQCVETGHFVESKTQPGAEKATGHDDSARLAGEYPDRCALINEALGKDYIRPGVITLLRDMLYSESKLRDFDRHSFKRKMDVSSKAHTPKVYFRKMSTAEYKAATKGKGTNPFRAAIDYVDTDNYRYWMSSCLEKVHEFGNEKATDAGGVIVKIQFKEDPLIKFKSTLKAHQEPGVQSDPSKLAMHREGFAEVGTFNCDDHVQEVLDLAIPHHNLGFTSDQADEMFGIMHLFSKQK